MERSCCAFSPRMDCSENRNKEKTPKVRGIFEPTQACNPKVACPSHTPWYHALFAQVMVSQAALRILEDYKSSSYFLLA